MSLQTTVEKASEAEELDLCVRAAHEAGRIAMGYFGRDPEVWFKNGHSPVSEADYAVDSFLKRKFEDERPQYGWVSEESEAVHDKVRLDDEPDSFYIVDPIDGTRAYLRGEATWCVSIALVRGERPVAGVIFAPVYEETFTVTRSGGAFLNGTPIAVREPNGTPGDGAMNIAIPDSLHKPFRTAPAEITDGISHSKGAPSLAYRLALVACGRLDATLIRPSAADWDIAAGDLLLERAGGTLTDADGKQTLYRRLRNRHGLLIAASRHAAEPMRRLADAILR